MTTVEKRQFLKLLAGAGLFSDTAIKNIEKILAAGEDQSPETLARNEDFWAEIRSEYRLKPDYINLENGYYCFMPRHTLERYIEHLREVNYQGSWYMRTVQWDNKRSAQARLAELAGVSPDEVIITRNTTESLDTVIGGVRWQAGDEAVFAEQDYFSMQEMFRQMQERYGVVIRKVSVPKHPKSDEEIVDLYASAITPKTRLLMVCHMINITGHILPIRKICDMAHSKGCEVMVDGAHAFAHIDFRIPDLDCDYYGTSLHKWLSVPLGAGMLYVKKEKIKGLWPLFADFGHGDDHIWKLNHTGTHPVHTDLAINDALDFHLMIGADRKEARLRYIQEYWTSRVRNLPNIEVNTPAESHRACGIANVGVKGMKPADMAKTLLDKYRIWTVAIDGAGVQGCRITPNVYTTTKELDRFVAALEEMGR